MSDRAVGAAPGYALRATDSANRINQLHDHQFAQLDAHNSQSHGLGHSFARFRGGFDAGIKELKLALDV